MRRSHPVVGAFLAVVFCVLLVRQNVAQESSGKSKSSSDEYKITPEDIARVNPVKATAEGLVEAKRVYGYDCEMCHGALGDGKGEVVESMKLSMRDWRDPATLEGKTDGELFYIITKGKGKMMGEGDRQPEQVRWKLVLLVRAMAAKGGTQKPAAAAATR